MICLLCIISAFMHNVITSLLVFCNIVAFVIIIIIIPMIMMICTQRLNMVFPYRTHKACFSITDCQTYKSFVVSIIFNLALSTLNVLNITSKFHTITITIFVTVD
jgi:hypothetical protein